MNIEELKSALKAEKTANKELKASYDKVVVEKENLEVLNTEKDAKIKELLASTEELKQAKLKITELESSNTEVALKDAQDRISELEALAEKNPAAKLVVDGTVTISKKKYTFKDGYLKTYNLKKELIDSSEALKDIELMKHLVKIKYAGIEEVK